MHPAHQLSFDELATGLDVEVFKGNVNHRRSPSGLTQYTYSKQCVFSQAWNPFTIIARGIILDLEDRRIVATPFPKFFNFGEHGSLWRSGPFETFEKVDGSLIIVYHHDGQWHTATKGSFGSEQAVKAKALLNAELLIPGHTYLFEYVGPSNRIVVRYEQEELVLLGCYSPQGIEINVAEVGRDIGVRPARAFSFSGFGDLKSHVDRLSSQEEGFVIRFDSGERLKLKGDEYCRVHRCISRVTPLAIWEAMAAGQSLHEFRMALPEEFWSDFDQIKSILLAALKNRIQEIYRAYEDTLHYDDRDLIKAGLPKDIESMVRARRKGSLHSNPKAQTALHKYIRPKSNVLPGYTPSSSITRFASEEST